MLNVTRAIDYAIRAMVCIANHPHDKVDMKFIARSEDISEVFLSKLLQAKNIAINDIPKDKLVTSQHYEGANLVIYSRDKSFFKNGISIIRELVSKYKKRIELILKKRK